MTMFGDYEDADAYDTAPPDPEQVARKLYRLQGGEWADLTGPERDYRRAIIVALLAWLHRQGAVT